MSLLFFRKTTSQYRVLSSTKVAKYFDPDNDCTHIGLQISVCTNCIISELVFDLSNGIRASFPRTHTLQVGSFSPLIFIPYIRGLRGILNLSYLNVRSSHGVFATSFHWRLRCLQFHLYRWWRTDFRFASKIFSLSLFTIVALSWMLLRAHSRLFLLESKFERRFGTNSVFFNTAVTLSFSLTIPVPWTFVESVVARFSVCLFSSLISSNADWSRHMWWGSARIETSVIP